eukprot:TRINITY_DN7742_c0_g1_i3.p1 TRINITY_DN7742_c0_g1~~TRINITY_DN7742_c0_g1_i3.p1  ORF type:complete len:349 (+),score=54.73 TRINITY_DN7742_c0_g1_i3:162-1208(+)
MSVSTRMLPSHGTPPRMEPTLILSLHRSHFCQFRPSGNERGRANGLLYDGKSSVSRRRGILRVVCAASGRSGGGGPIKVVVNGVTNELGQAAVRAVSRARGLQLAGVVDINPGMGGRDTGELVGLDDVELPVSGDLITVLASVAQSRENAAVLVDLESGPAVYENIRQATAFGLKTVVTGEGLDAKKLKALIEFCDKASMGCLIAPTLSIGQVLLQQAAVSAAFHYSSAQILEEQEQEAKEPSVAALEVAEALGGLGRVFAPPSESTSSGAENGSKDLGDGVMWHSRQRSELIGPFQRCLGVDFSATGQVFSIRHEMTSADALMPGLLLAIRKVARLKTLVVGLEKVL